MNSETRSLSAVIGLVAAAIAVVLAVVYGSVALYRGSWDLTNANAARSYQLQKKNTDRQTKILHGSQSYQSATSSDLTQKVEDITTITVQMDGVARTSQQYSDLHAQRLGEANLACADAVQLTTIPAQQASWVRVNCQAGAVALTSPLRK